MEYREALRKYQGRCFKNGNGGYLRIVKLFPYMGSLTDTFRTVCEVTNFLYCDEGKKAQIIWFINDPVLNFYDFKRISRGEFDNVIKKCADYYEQEIKEKYGQIPGEMLL